MTEILMIGSSVVAAMVAGAGTAWLTRGRTRAEGYATRAEGDSEYADLAVRAWREAEHLRRRLLTHDRRWRLAAVLLERCASDNPEMAAALAELNALNGLQEIDEAGNT